MCFEAAVFRLELVPSAFLVGLARYQLGATFRDPEFPPFWQGGRGGDLWRQNDQHPSGKKTLQGLKYF